MKAVSFHDRTALVMACRPLFFSLLRSLLLTLFLGGTSLAAEETPPVGLKPNIPELAKSKQLILVTVSDWDSVSAQLRCFERSESAAPWMEAAPPFEVTIGRSGLAWGIGLHGTHPGTGKVKREGDGRAPAGVFALSEGFGYASSAEARITRFPYRQLTPTLEGVDDPQSMYYNRIVDSAAVKDKDWKSAEQMLRDDELYRWGIVVEHNSKPYPGSGSCIFLHIWQGPGRGTAGCTAMAAGQMERLLRWVDQKSHPLFVQLPAAEYARLKGQWMLP